MKNILDCPVKLAMKYWLLVISVLCVALPLVGTEQCETCNTITKNIFKGIKKTAKANFGGGNTDWEEKSLGSYTFSETRLVEVLEKACDDESKACHPFLEEHEETIENWWFKHYAKGQNKDLKSFLCIQQIKVCCPNGTYGEDCSTCTGGSDTPCKGNGKCDGDGTRKGTGKCLCDDGYQGDLCDECRDGYFEEKNETHITCAACHASCDDGCSGAGAKACTGCKDGWEERGEEGCIDIDECDVESGPCEENEYCLNTEGSYKCQRCHRSCKGCNGEGADDCIECNSRYYREEDKCEACHFACTECWGNSSAECTACQAGWDFKEGEGCVDIDECLTANCTDEEYCVNTEGTYTCVACDPSCNLCIGSGAEHCRFCKVGYKRVDKVCLDIDECRSSSVCEGAHEKCLNTEGSYSCLCQSGYTRKGKKCILKPKGKKKKAKQTKLDKFVDEMDALPSDSDPWDKLEEMKALDQDKDDMIVMQGDFLPDPTHDSPRSPDGANIDSAAPPGEQIEKLTRSSDSETLQLRRQEEEVTDENLKENLVDTDVSKEHIGEHNEL